MCWGMTLCGRNGGSEIAIEEITGTAAAKECGIPLATFRYRTKIYEKQIIIIKGVFLQECVPFCKENPLVFYSLICVVSRQIGMENFTVP